MSEPFPFDPVTPDHGLHGLDVDAKPAEPVRRRRWPRILAWGSLAALAVVVMAAAALHQVLGTLGVGTADLVSGLPDGRVFGDRDRVNILCLGVDYNHDSKAQLYTKWVRSDTIFVVSLDRKAQTLNVLSIPRDTRVDIPRHGTDKINAAFAMKERGDIELTRTTVERFLGVPLDHYVIIKGYAAERVVDAIGGVTINVEQDMDYDDNWGGLHIHLKKGVQRLDGKQAVGYIRFRHDAEGDRGRMRRQQRFLAAMMSEMKSLNTLPRLNAICRAVRSNLQTDLEFRDVVSLAWLYRSFDRSKMKTARVDGQDAFHDGVYYMDTDEALKRRLVARLLRDRDAVAPQDVRLEILNGSEVVGAARRLADTCQAQGYQIVRVATAPAGPSAVTHLVDHRNDPKVCQSVTHLLGAVPVEQDRAPNPSADITIVLGRDWHDRAN